MFQPIYSGLIKILIKLIGLCLFCNNIINTTYLYYISLKIIIVNDIQTHNSTWLLLTNIQTSLEQQNVCDFLRERVGVNYSEELIHSIAGMLDVNCHELRSHQPGNVTRSIC